MAIDFSLSTEQLALQQAARRFARTVLVKVRPTIAAFAKPEERFFATRPFYAEMANNGFVHALVPAAFGGQGLSTLDFALAAEELAAIDINVPTTVLATDLGLQPVIGFGTDCCRRPKSEPVIR